MDNGGGGGVVIAPTNGDMGVNRGDAVGVNKGDVIAPNNGDAIVTDGKLVVEKDATREGDAGTAIGLCGTLGWLLLGVVGNSETEVNGCCAELPLLLPAVDGVGTDTERGVLNGEALVGGRGGLGGGIALILLLSLGKPDGWFPGVERVLVGDLRVNGEDVEAATGATGVDVALASFGDACHVFIMQEAED